jgi:hypothetical protein
LFLFGGQISRSLEFDYGLPRVAVSHHAQMDILIGGSYPWSNEWQQSTTSQQHQ